MNLKVPQTPLYTVLYLSLTLGNTGVYMQQRKQLNCYFTPSYILPCNLLSILNDILTPKFRHSWHPVRLSQTMQCQYCLVPETSFLCWQLLHRKWTWVCEKDLCDHQQLLSYSCAQLELVLLSLLSHACHRSLIHWLLLLNCGPWSQDCNTRFYFYTTFRAVICWNQSIYCLWVHERICAQNSKFYWNHFQGSESQKLFYKGMDFRLKHLSHGTTLALLFPFLHILMHTRMKRPLFQQPQCLLNALVPQTVMHTLGCPLDDIATHSVPYEAQLLQKALLKGGTKTSFVCKKWFA